MSNHDLFLPYAPCKSGVLNLPVWSFLVGDKTRTQPLGQYSWRVSENIIRLIKENIVWINGNSLGSDMLNRETMSFLVLHSWCWDWTVASAQWKLSGFSSVKPSVSQARYLREALWLRSPTEPTFLLVTGMGNKVFLPWDSCHFVIQNWGATEVTSVLEYHFSIWLATFMDSSQEFWVNLPQNRTIWFIGQKTYVVHVFSLYERLNLY